MDDSQIFDHEQQNAQRNYSDRAGSRQAMDHSNGQNGYDGQDGHYSEQQQQYYQYDDDRDDGASGSQQNGNRDNEMW